MAARQRPMPAAASALAALALALGACGGEEEPASAPAEETDAVSIEDFEFLPADITVPAGTEVTFTNDDTAAHTATSGDSPDSDGTFDTGTIDEGDEKGVKLDEAGELAYFCELHPNMTGTITVE